LLSVDVKKINLNGDYLTYSYNVFGKMITSHTIKKSSPHEIRFVIKTIIVLILLSLSVSFFIFGLLSVKRQKNILYAEKLKTGEIILRHLVNNAAMPLIGDDALTLNSLIKETKSIESLAYAIITDKENSIKAHTDPSKIGVALKEYKSSEAFTSNDDIVKITHTDPRGMHILNISLPVKFMHKTLGYVHLGLSLDFIQSEIKSETTALVQYILLLGVVIIIIFGVFFSWRG
jgi:sensor histidine kinase regulating citrate/malate metabolism